MIFVFRPAASMSARLLAEAVDGVRIKRPENLIRRARGNDKVVMWGAHLDGVQGLVLNNRPLQNKFEDALRLREAGVPTIEVSRTRPAPPAPIVQPTPIDPLIALWDTAQDAAEAFANLPMTRNLVAQGGVEDLIGALGRVQTAMRVPAPVAPPSVQPVSQIEWLGRTYNHVGGNDLLHPGRADFYAKREQLVNEYRVHSFIGHSIRAGKKIPRTPNSETPFNGTPHAWIRSFDAGWQISYDGEQVRQRHRDLAHSAVNALGLQFGAVDIGEKQNGELIVLEVNRAPGVEAGSVSSYARAIRRWVEGEWTV